MRNSGNALPLQKRRRVHQGTRSDEEHIFPFSAIHFCKYQTAQHRRGAAAAGSAAVHILRFCIVDQKAAVVVSIGDGSAVQRHLLRNGRAAQSGL